MDRGALAAGMAVDVGEAFLHEAVNDEFGIGGEPAEIFGDAQRNIEIAALDKALHVPSERFGQAIFVEKRRVQKIRHRANFLAQLLHELLRVFGILRKSGTDAPGKGTDYHAQNGERLPGAIVKFPGNVTAFAILDLQHPARNIAQLSGAPKKLS